MKASCPATWFRWADTSPKEVLLEPNELRLPSELDTGRLLKFLLKLLNALRRPISLGPCSEKRVELETDSRPSLEELAETLLEMEAPWTATASMESSRRQRILRQEDSADTCRDNRSVKDVCQQCALSK